MIHQILGGDILNLDGDRFVEVMRRHSFSRFGVREISPGSMRVLRHRFGWHPDDST
jgi:hypothetical protein